MAAENPGEPAKVREYGFAKFARQKEQPSAFFVLECGDLSPHC